MTYTVAEMKSEMLSMRERMRDHEGLMDKVSSGNIVRVRFPTRTFQCARLVTLMGEGTPDSPYVLSDEFQSADSSGETVSSTSSRSDAPSPSSGRPSAVGPIRSVAVTTGQRASRRSTRAARKREASYGKVTTLSLIGVTQY